MHHHPPADSESFPFLLSDTGKESYRVLSISLSPLQLKNLFPDFIPGWTPLFFLFTVMFPPLSPLLW
jgi:hypothetical protein